MSRLSWTSGARSRPLREHGYAHLRAPARGRSRRPRRPGRPEPAPVAPVRARDRRLDRRARRASSGGRPSSRRRSCRPRPAEIAALIGAIALYGLATRRARRALAAAARGRGRDAAPRRHVRADRRRLHGQQHPARARRRRDPRRPRWRRARRRPSAPWSARCVAERLLDVAVLLVIFVVVGYGLLGEVGGNSVELIAIVADRRRSPRPPSAGASSAATRSCTACWRRSRRATLGLRRAHHGLRLLGHDAA